MTGDETRYKQDVNLDDGVRVLDLAVSYVPERNGGTVDRIDLEASNLGGDPYEEMHVEVKKYGAYELKLDRRRSQYFYDDTILPPALANFTSATGGDFHTLDFERIRQSADLSIDVSPVTKLRFDLERQTRTGDSAVPRGEQRDQFELQRPIDESLDAFTAGVEHHWDKVTLIVDERAETFHNAVEMFLPGASLGENTGDLSTLSFFSLDQSYDYRSRVHSVRVLLDPTPRVDLRVAWQGQTLDLDTAPSEQSAGTTFTGAPFTTNISGAGAVSRDIDQSGVDFRVAVNDRIHVIGALRDSGLDQTGNLVYEPDISNGLWNIDTTGYEAGVEVALREKFVVTGGWSGERRDVKYTHDLSGEVHAGAETTRREGYFASVAFNPTRTLDLSANVETNSIDDPFTLSSPTGSTRYKLKARQRWNNGWSLSGSFRRTDLDNTHSGWAGNTDALTVRVDYRHDRLGASFGAGRVRIDRRIDQTVTGGTRTDFFHIDYAADVDTLDGAVNWRIDKRFTVGTDLHRYANYGSFPVDRDDLRAYFAMDVGPAYVVQVSYRDLHYREDTYDDYDARLVELSLRIKW